MVADRSSSLTGRREPPAFRHMNVVETRQMTPHMIRVSFGGAGLAGLVIDAPAASVRILLPSPGKPDLVMPQWNGNEFLLADGSRPVIRTFTPRHFDPKALVLDIDMVVHEGGIASLWAQSAQPGAAAALSGPGRGYTIDAEASDYLLVGDESAIPAISQLLESLSPNLPIRVDIEIGGAEARLDLPHHPAATIGWHVLGPDQAPGEALADAVEAAQLSPDSVVWCAGEAASMHRIRNHLFREVGLARSQATVRGYWKIDRKP